MDDAKALSLRCLCDAVQDALFRASIIESVIRNDDELREYFPNHAVRHIVRAYLIQFEGACQVLWDYRGGYAWSCLAAVDINPDVVSEAGISGRSNTEVAQIITERTFAMTLAACYGKQAAIDLRLRGPREVPRLRLSGIFRRLGDLRAQYNDIPPLDVASLSIRIEKECERALTFSQATRSLNPISIGPTLLELREKELGQNAPQPHQSNQAGVQQKKRFVPPPCPDCGSKAKVASSRGTIRLLKCPQCEHRWQLVRA